ncbi:MAG: tRNA lysidine(34) synthetase TilS [Rhizomicrobium sp.]|nr:tRNA lysidine(34) synthetase TilS [Rhizomicrobium sp.]
MAAKNSAPSNSELRARFALAMTGAVWPAAVGVSGGSDSLALMLLLADWAKAQGLAPPLVFCVDHGLRAEAKAEGKKVMAWARAAGLRGTVLRDDTALPTSDNLEAAARALRYRLMGEAMRKKKLAALYVAHSEDDQAETFLLRLGRGSGVDGLSGMRALAPFPDPNFPELRLARPLLSFSRAVLREYLAGINHPWIDDPMNADPRFARVRVRQAWPQLAALGLTPARLVEACSHLARARQSLEIAAEAVVARACRPYAGGVLIDPVALGQAPAELALRALAGILMLVSSNPYRPRFDRLRSLFAAIAAGGLGGGRTLHGCRIAPAPKPARLFGPVTLLISLENRQKRAKPPTNS